jgi:predicted secreted hydrolase
LRLLHAVAAVVLLAAPLARGQDSLYRPALPGYVFDFPRDHFAHPDFKTEWWYYTGNLRTDDGQAFGFELTFFREGLPNPYANPSRWRLEQLYIAHLAVTDARESAFAYDQRMHRGALELAGARTAADCGPGIADCEARVWVRDWSVVIGESRHRLDAPGKDIGVQLELVPLKAPVIHGHEGVSRKGPSPGSASHYYSFTRLQADGAIRFRGRRHKVSGLAWMDHQFSSSALAPGQAGWDWFSLQFPDGSELMLYQLRRADGTPDLYSAGTYVPAAGGPLPLEVGQFFLTARPSSSWRSPHSGGRYPLQWQLRVPSLQIEVEIAAVTPDQELTTKETTGVTYWEGAVRATGQKQGANIVGRGYLEMTGYAPK